MKLVNLFLSFPVSAQFRIESKGEYLTFLFLNSILYVRSREIFVWCWSWFHKNTPSWRAAGRIQKRGRVFWSFRKMEKTTNFVEWFFYIFGYFGFPFIDFENLAKSELFFWLHVCSNDFMVELWKWSLSVLTFGSKSATTTSRWPERLSMIIIIEIRQLELK